MDKMILSMKAIYKTLMFNDFPIYSESVIPEKMRKGQTLLRFWQEIILDAFRNGPWGQQIWHSEGKRNRALSNLCNRSKELRIYDSYAEELMGTLDPQLMLEQTERFMKVLSSREYRHDILIRRIQELLRLCQEGDRKISGRVFLHLQEAMNGGSQLDRFGPQGRLFHAGYLMTLLSLYAMTGDAMDKPATLVLEDKRYAPGTLWQLRSQQRENPSWTVEYLTVRCGSMQDELLPRQRFFGREEELYDLREMAISGRKCLISGMGGLGKTELLRQLLKLCQQERIADLVAVVSYTTSLAQSMIQAFGDNTAGRADEVFRRILTRLRREGESGKRVLLLLDDMSKGSEEDPELLELQNLPCGVMITSRRRSLEGFTTYSLTSPSSNAAALIFRDNYGSPLTAEDRGQLHQMLQDETLHHPLTLNLMARAARGQQWSVAQLRSHLKNDGLDMRWVEDVQPLNAMQIFRRLYSLVRVPEEGKQIVELFTLLPHGSYSQTLLCQLFPEQMGREPQEKLRWLVDGGWLEHSASGYAMHPLIAESLRRRVLTEDRLQWLIQSLHGFLPPFRVITDESIPDPVSTASAGILLHVSGLMTGGISRELFLDQLTAAASRMLTQAEKEHLALQVNQWYKRCRDLDDRARMRRCTVLCGWNLAQQSQIGEIRKDWSRGCEEDYMEFCLLAGLNLIYLQKPQPAKELLGQVLSGPATPDQKAMAYYHLSGCGHLLGSPEEAFRWCKEGVDYVNRHPECGKLPRFNNLHMLCNMHLKYRHREQAQELLRQLADMMEGSSRPDLNAQYLSVLGLYEMAFGDPGKALEHMQGQRQLHEECFGRDRDYYLLQSMIAQTMSLQQRFEESLETYFSVIAYARQAGDRQLLQSASNNISVAYLKYGQPEMALPHLETAVSLGRSIGGLMLGEALRNSAICHGMLKTRDLELDFYRQAMPLLLEAYGPDHPRAAAAMQRLAELEEEAKEDVNHVL